MGYDLHVVRTTEWFEAEKDPIRLDEVDAVVTADPELQWSKTDYVDMLDDNGSPIRSWMIEWSGSSRFWWDRDQILYKSADDYVQVTKKLLQIADKLGALVVGDDGEIYSVARGLLGGEKLIYTDSEGRKKTVK